MILRVMMIKHLPISFLNAAISLAVNVKSMEELELYDGNGRRGPKWCCVIGDLLNDLQLTRSETRGVDIMNMFSNIQFFVSTRRQIRMSFYSFKELF